MSSVTVRDVVGWMNRVAPEWMRMGSDPVGLHVGNLDAEVRRVMFALDATLPVIAEAIDKEVDMLITHHPRFYQPLLNLAEDRMMGRIGSELVRAGIALYCAHTNLDVALGGVNDVLADMAGMAKVRVPLLADVMDDCYKLVVFVPKTHLEVVRKGICDAGAGVGVGNYSDCSFWLAGVGSFMPCDGAKPYLGRVGSLERVEECRLEVLLRASCKGEVLAALRSVHPYEEIAYDLYPVLQKVTFGQGRVGELERVVSLQDLALRMRDGCKSTSTLVFGAGDKLIRRVGIWSGGGFGAKYVARHGVDAVVLGEVNYHELEILQDMGVGCIALGHAACEEVILPVLASKIGEEFELSEVLVSKDAPKMRCLL